MTATTISSSYFECTSMSCLCYFFSGSSLHKSLDLFSISSFCNAI